MSADYRSTHAAIVPSGHNEPAAPLCAAIRAEGEHEMVNVAEQERTLARDYGVRQRQGQGDARRGGEVP